MGSDGLPDAKESLKDEDSRNGLLSGARGDDDDDDDSELLLPSIRSGLPKKQGMPRRTVQWNDKNGNKLAEILEFQPSEASESDDEESEACFCTIM